MGHPGGWDREKRGEVFDSTANLLAPCRPIPLRHAITSTAPPWGMKASLHVIGGCNLTWIDIIAVMEPYFHLPICRQTHPLPLMAPKHPPTHPKAYRVLVVEKDYCNDFSLISVWENQRPTTAMETAPQMN